MAGIAGVAAAALAYGAVFHLLPYLQYKNAAQLLENNDLAAAHVKLEAMGPYRDAP